MTASNITEDRGNRIIAACDKYDLCCHGVPHEVAEAAERIARIAPLGIIEVESPKFTLIVLQTCPYRGGRDAA